MVRCRADCRLNWHVGRLERHATCQSFHSPYSKPFLFVLISEQFIGALSELVWSQIENVAQDLEAFAKHSGRTTINSKDVVLLGRRNEGLKDLLQKEADDVSGKK